MAKKDKALVRIEAQEGSPFASLSKMELLLHPDQQGAALELYRRAVNKAVKKQQG